MQRRRAIPWIVASAGLAVAVGFFFNLKRIENARINAEFQRRSLSLASNLEQSLRNCDETLRSLRDLYHYSDDVTRTEFTLAASDLIARHPAVAAFFWAPRVEPAARRAFEQDVRESTQTDFSIYPDNTGPDDAVFPVLYTTPYGIAHLEGFDLARSKTWSRFVEAARGGAPLILGHPPFLEAEFFPDHVLLAVPVYLNCVPSAEEERLQRLHGFLLALINPAVLVEEASRHSPNHGLEVMLLENQPSGLPRLLHLLAQRPPGVPAPSAADFFASRHLSTPIRFEGTEWSLVCRPSADWLASQRTFRAFNTATLTLLFFLALAVYLRALLRRTGEIESTVAERTLALTRTQEILQQDIERMNSAELALKISEERYRMLVRQSSDSIGRLEINEPIDITTDPDIQVHQILERARIAECNDTAVRCYGAKDAQALIGRPLIKLTLSSKERQHRVIAAFVKSGYRLTDFEAVDPAPRERIFVHNLFGAVENGRLTGIWIIERELTEQRRMEQERQTFERRLADAQRLESLGVLAGGIAHDFNNLLTGILGHASLGRTEISPDSPLNEHFEQIECASRSAASLCQQMLAYAGKGRFVIKPEDLSKIVSGTVHLLQASISKQSELHFALDEHLPRVLVDATQIQQIIMNLVVNASESFGTGRGSITITTGLLQASEAAFENCAFAPESLAATYVFLRVGDTGPGMSRDVLGRIFEPFFTTKFAGRGLGLAAALGIVRRHNGALKVESTVGAGTHFTLLLPVPDQPLEPEAASTGSNTPWNAEGTLLVVDDEAPVRNIAERIAHSLGFSVLTASGGQQGLELFQQHRQEISLVLLDLTMPGLSGDELIARLRALSPEVVLVIMSGYNQPPAPPESELTAPIFLSKPFTLSQFETAVRHALRRRK